MPQYQFTEESTGRTLILEGDEPPDQQTVDGAFRNYDALSVSSAGPAGSEARRRARAQTVARQSQESFTQESGGSTAGPVRSGLASFPATAARAGTDLLRTLGQAGSYLTDAIGGPIAGQPVPPENLTASGILEQAQQNPLVRTAESLQRQADVTYPVNPQQTIANLPGSAVASALSTVAGGPLAIPSYAAQSFSQGVEESLNAGATEEQAVQQGLVQAVTGAATERLLGVVPGLREAASGAMRGVVRPTVRAVVGESVQEPAEGILNRLSAKYVTGGQPDVAVFDPATLALEAAGGAIGGGAVGGGVALANQAGRNIRAAQLREARDPYNQLQQIVEEAPINPEPSRQTTRNIAPPQPVSVSTTQTDMGLTQPVEPEGQTPIDRMVRQQRRENVEAGLIAPQPAVQPEPPAVGQYPEEGFGTGTITPPEEQARRAQVRNQVAERNRVEAEQARASVNQQQVQQAQALIVAARQAEAERQQEVLARYERMRSRPPITTPFLEAVNQPPVQANEVQNQEAGPVLDVSRVAPVQQTTGQAPQGTPQQTGPGPEVANAPAFDVRGYRGSTITVGQVGDYNQRVAELAAQGDETAQRVMLTIAEIEGPRGVGRFSGYAGLTGEGQNRAQNYYSNALYRSIGKWLDGGKFTFAALPVSRSAVSSAGKLNAEQMAQRTQGEEAVNEESQDTNLTRLSEPVLPKIKPAAPIKIAEDVTATIRNLMDELGIEPASLARLVSAHERNDLSDLDDAEVEAYAAARPTLENLTRLKYSVGDYVRAPLGLAEAQAAVDQWLVETGANADIRVVFDPNLRTQDGTNRSVAALVGLNPNAPPTILINAANIGSVGEVREKLWHEAFHTVWDQPDVADAWKNLTDELTPAQILAERARGYDAQEAIVEAAINYGASKAGRPAWKKFLDAVWKAMQRLFGLEVRPADFETLMVEAIRQLGRPWNQGGDGLRYSVANNLYVTNPEAFRRIATEGQTQAVTAQGNVATSIIPGAVIDQLGEWSKDPDALGPVDSVTVRALKPLANVAATKAVADEFAQAEGQPAYDRISDLPVELKSIGAHAVMAAHLYLDNSYKKLSTARTRALERLGEAADRVARLDSERLVAESANQEAGRLLDGLLQQITLESERLGTSIEATSKQRLSDEASRVLGLKRDRRSAVSAALLSIVQEMPVSDFNSAQSVRDWLTARLADKSRPALMSEEVGRTLLRSFNASSNIHNRLSALRALVLDPVAAKAELAVLQKELGSKSKRSIVQKIASLKTEETNAKKNVRLADQAFERAENRVLGLTQAMEMMEEVAASPQYQEKVGEAVNYGNFTRSGMIRFTEGRPSGVQELKGPSGKTYRIDFRPDFAVEKENLKQIEDYFAEVQLALTDPTNPYFLTDPLTRNSFETSARYVSRYLSDRRYTYESAWQESPVVKSVMMLTGSLDKLPWLHQFLKEHLTTRYNLYRWLGGRAGDELVRRSNAIDLFEKKAKNVLDRTKTRNGELRKKSMEVHGLNPNDPQDVETWDREINNALLSQNQNPGSSPYKVGDRLPTGYVVEPVDLEMSALQSQTSSELIKAFTGEAGEVSDPDAPGILPEEQLYGLFIRRRQEQFGTKTPRKFSQEGETYIRRWFQAKEADQRAYEALAAQATGAEPVPMVWTEREKVAGENLPAVLSHIVESNPEYNSASSKAMQAIYKLFRKDLRNGRIETPETLAEIYEELASRSPENSPVSVIDARQSLLEGLDREVDSVNRASGVVGAVSPAESISERGAPVINRVTQAQSALVKARGRMVGSSYFYDYGLATDFERNALVRLGKDALGLAEIRAAQNALAAMRTKREEFDQRIVQLTQQIGRDGRHLTRDQAVAELDRQLEKEFKGGEQFTTYRLLTKAISHLSTAIEDRISSIQRQHVSELEAQKARVARGVISGVATTLLSSVPSMINNSSSAVVEPMRMGTITGSLTYQLAGAFKGAVRLFEIAAKRMLVNAIPKKVRAQILSGKTEGVMAKLLGRLLHSHMVERQSLEDAGIIDPAESFGEIWRRIRANQSTFGETTRLAESQWSRKLSLALNHWLLGNGTVPALGIWLRQNIPGAVDRIVNQAMSESVNDMEGWIGPKLYNWAKAKPDQRASIKPEDFNLEPDQLAGLRNYFQPAGSLEALAHALYDRNPERMTAESPVLTPEQRDLVRFNVVRATNLESDSTKPDFFKEGAGATGALKAASFMFSRYVLQWMGVTNQLMGTKGGAGWKRDLEKALTYLGILILSLMSGALLFTPLKQLWNSYALQNPLTAPTLLQAMDSPEMAARYLAAAGTGVLPVGSGLLTEAMGGNGFQQPLTANFFDNNPVAGFFNNVLTLGQQVNQSESFKYPMSDFLKKSFWPAQLVINRAMEGDTAAREAIRSVRASSAGLEVRPSSGSATGARQTPMTPLIRDAIAALYEGNAGAYGEARSKALEYLMKNGATQKEAERRFESSVQGREPFRSVLGRTPTEEELTLIQRRVSPGQRATLGRAAGVFKPRTRRPKSLRLRSSRRRSARLRRPRSVRLRRASAS